MGIGVPLSPKLVRQTVKSAAKFKKHTAAVRTGKWNNSSNIPEHNRFVLKTRPAVKASDCCTNGTSQKWRKIGRRPWHSHDRLRQKRLGFGESAGTKQLLLRFYFASHQLFDQKCSECHQKVRKSSQIMLMSYFSRN